MSLNEAILAAMDFVLGWLLCLPRDASLLALGIGTAALLTLVRRYTTNQDLLKRCRADKRRLRELLRESKRRGDGDAIRRHRATSRMIALKAARSEGRPLLVAIVPLALLGVWAFQRLEYHPLEENEPIQVRAYFPVSAEGRVVHVVPRDGVRADNGWIQQIRIQDDGAPVGVATWTLRAPARPDPYELELRYEEATYHRTLIVGPRKYAAPVTRYGDRRVIGCEVQLRQVKLFSVVPGLPALCLAPWLVAYLIVAIPSVAVLRLALRVY